MACDTDALLEAARCYQCFFDGVMGEAAELVLLCAIRDGEAIDCDAQSLMNQANCLICQMPPGAIRAAKVAVLCQIAAT
jgi:hypothetical protein